MEKNKKTPNKLQIFWQKTTPMRQWIYRLRGLLMAIPVGVVAVILAMRNMVRLPDRVGLLLLSSGEYQWMVAKVTAVALPLAVTGICLVLMFLSRRTVYPWLISIFSLVLPFVIYLTNVFPA